MNDECVRWAGRHDRGGYGLLPGKRTVYAHRHAWEGAHGPIPPKTYVLQRCGTLDCVNLAHLFLSTRKRGWKGDRASDGLGRGRARRQYPVLGGCQHDGCTAPARDRHHRDANPRNNDPANVRFLCRKHHMAEDGRAATLRPPRPPSPPPSPCRICGRVGRGLRRGRCGACDAYHRRHGTERPARPG